MELINILKILFICLLSYNNNFVISTGNEQQSVDFNKFKIITLNYDGSYSVNDKNKYKFINDDFVLNVSKFVFKNWSKCVKVMYGDDVVWNLHENENEYPSEAILYYDLNGLGLYLQSSSYYYEFIDGNWVLKDYYEHKSTVSTPWLYKEVKPLLVESGLMTDSQLDYVLSFGVLCLLMSVLMSAGLTINYLKLKSKRLNEFKPNSVTVV